MRIIVFATSAFAVPSLERLAAGGLREVLCVTQPDRRQGRGLRSLPSPVATAGRRLGLALEEPPTAAEALPRCREFAPEAGVVVAYGQRLPRALLDLPRHGMLGLHPSLLPRYRGANPVAWAILNGETATGVTVFRLTERLDDGDIALQETLPIAPDDTTDTLSARLAARGAELLATALARLEQGHLSFQAQEERLATYAPKFAKAHGRIDWTQPAAAIERLVRAAVPWPGAYTSRQGTPLKVWKASCQDAPSAVGRPGAVLHVAPEGLTVAAGEGAVVIHEVQPAGRRRMGVREFLAGHPMRAGEILQ